MIPLPENWCPSAVKIISEKKKTTFFSKFTHATKIFESVLAIFKRLHLTSDTQLACSQLTS